MGMAGYCREIQRDGLVICLETVEISNASIYNIMCWSVFGPCDEDIDIYTSEDRVCRTSTNTDALEIEVNNA